MDFDVCDNGELCLRPTPSENRIIRAGIRKIIMESMTTNHEIIPFDAASRLVDYYGSSGDANLRPEVHCREPQLRYFMAVIDAITPDLGLQDLKIAGQALDDILEAAVEIEARAICPQVPDYPLKAFENRD